MRVDQSLFAVPPHECTKDGYILRISCDDNGHVVNKSMNIKWIYYLHKDRYYINYYNK